MFSQHYSLRRIAIVIFLVFAHCLAKAQSPLRHMYINPSGMTVRVIKDIAYSEHYKFDLYQPQGPVDSTVVVIMNGFGIPNQKNADYQVEWARVLAEDGIHAITFESHSEDVEGDFDQLVEHLKHSGQYAIDPEKLMVMAFSGNVVKGMPIITDPKRTSIKAAVIYYGYGPVHSFKPHLPVLYIRSGLDNPNLNKNIDSLALLAFSNNAPWNFINHHSGKHPFEFDAADGQSILVIKETLDFFHNAVSAPMQESIASKMDEIRAGTALFTQDWATAVTGYEKLSSQNPTADNYLKLGHALRGSKQYLKAVQAYEKSFQAGERRMADLAIPASLSAAYLKDRKLVLKWAGRLPKTPWAKSFLLNTTEFSFIKDDPAWSALTK